MICSPGLIFGGTYVVWSRFDILRSWTRFRWYRGRRVPFSCFALLDMFSAVSRPSGPLFLFCTPGIIFVGSEVVENSFLVLRTRTYFRRYRGPRVPFSCFALPDLFSTVSRESGPVFMFCTLGLIFFGTEGAGSRFHILRGQTLFWRYRWRRVPFSSFARPNSFLAVPPASGHVLMFCTSGLVFGGFDGIWSRFQALRPRTHFLWY
jgi:hypothetical protein